MNFFGLEIRAFRIDESRPAPQFSVISSPNNTTKVAREELSSNERKSKDELMSTAANRHVEAITAILHKLAYPIECVWSEPSRTYGGSFRCWRKSPDGKSPDGNWRMVLGINISGQRKQTPDGQLDIWLPVASIAAVSETSIEEVQHALAQLPVYAREAVDWIVRLKDEDQAELTVKVLSEYFGVHPGAYATDGVSQPDTPLHVAHSSTFA